MVVERLERVVVCGGPKRREESCEMGAREELPVLVRVGVHVLHMSPDSRDDRSGLLPNRNWRLELRPERLSGVLGHLRARDRVGLRCGLKRTRGGQRGKRGEKVAPALKVAAGRDQFLLVPDHCHFSLVVHMGIKHAAGFAEADPLQAGQFLVGCH